MPTRFSSGSRNQQPPDRETAEGDEVDQHRHAEKLLRFGVILPAELDRVEHRAAAADQDRNGEDDHRNRHGGIHRGQSEVRDVFADEHAVHDNVQIADDQPRHGGQRQPQQERHDPDRCRVFRFVRPCVYPPRLRRKKSTITENSVISRDCIQYTPESFGFPARFEKIRYFFAGKALTTPRVKPPGVTNEPAATSSSVKRASRISPRSSRSWS